MKRDRAPKLVEPFEFEHEGRRYSCSAEARAGGNREVWWWFRVSGEAQRHALFQATEGDTRESVEAQVIAYHRALLERRTTAAQAPQPWWQRRTQTSKS
jgi:hypothetical protein